MKETMWFGKHKGKKVSDVIMNFPSYALWAHQNVRGFVLAPSEILDCLARSDIGPRAGRDDPDWMESDDDDYSDLGEYGGMSYSDFGNN